MRGLILTVLLLAVSAAAEGVAATRAKRSPAPSAPASGDSVSEIVVTPQAKCLTARPNLAARSPRIVGTFPADNAVIRPGLLVVRITFDRPMTCSGFLMDRAPLRSPCPLARQKMVLTFDRRTIRLLCETTANTTYGLRIGDEMFHAFTSLEARPAAPQELTFTTNDGPRIEGVPEALAQDR